MINKIVLTGGPCGGKSKALEYLGRILKERGYFVLCFPEIPLFYSRAE